jgi:ribose 5-phosphate isomerase RpiB
MKVAVINETSAADRNADILRALEGRGHEIINCGMKKNGQAPELTYVHTGTLAGLLLGCGKADLVIGGCGTGVGFLNAAVQFPRVVCGLLQSPLDAFLFPRINGGNCISLALNLGYGWAADRNLSFLFDQFFAQTLGSGYPEHRRESQGKSRILVENVSLATHRDMAEIIGKLPDEALLPAIHYPGIKELMLQGEPLEASVAAALQRRWAQ